MARIIFLFFLIYSFNVYADSYPAAQTCGVIGFGYSGGSIGEACAKMTANTIYNASPAGDRCTVTYKSNGQSAGYAMVSCGYVVCSYGGAYTSVGNMCIGAPSCPAGQSRAVTGMCKAPCVTGQKNTIYVERPQKPLSTTPTFQLTQDRSGVVGVSQVHETSVVGGCVYELPLNPRETTGCIDLPNGNVRCAVYATMNGTELLGGDTGLDASVLTPDSEAACLLPRVWNDKIKKCSVSSAKEGCYKTSMGDEVCPVSSEKNCGQVNGMDVCVKDAPYINGYPQVSINDQPLATKTNLNGATDNCYLDDGRVICVDPSTTVDCTRFMCLKPDVTSTAIPLDKPIQLSKDVRQQAKSTTVSNADGTKTVTTVTTTNLVNSTPTTTTTVINAAGQTVSSNTVVGDSNGKGLTDNVAAPVTAGAMSGRFYVSDSTRTMSGVVSARMEQLKNTPVLSFGKSILAVNIPQGSPPIFTIPPIMGMSPITVDVFSGTSMDIIWSTVSGVLKILAVYLSLLMVIGGRGE